MVNKKRLLILSSFLIITTVVLTIFYKFKISTHFAPPWMTMKIVPFEADIKAIVDKKVEVNGTIYVPYNVVEALQETENVTLIITDDMVCYYYYGLYYANQGLEYEVKKWKEKLAEEVGTTDNETIYDIVMKYYNNPYYQTTLKKVDIRIPIYFRIDKKRWHTINGKLDDEICIILEKYYAPTIEEGIALGGATFRWLGHVPVIIEERPQLSTPIPKEVIYVIVGVVVGIIGGILIYSFVIRRR